MTVMLGNPQSLNETPKAYEFAGMIKKDHLQVCRNSLQVVRLNRLGLTTVPGMCLKHENLLEIASDHSRSWTAHS